MSAVLSQATRLLHTKQLAAAEALCRQILDAEPGHAGALHLLGLVAFEARNWQAAIDLVQQAIRADGSVAFYHSNLCEICRQVGRLEEALAAGERALALDPSSARTHNNLGIVHYDRGEYASAEDCYRRALALAPDLVPAHGNLANALRAQHRFEEAIAAYHVALALDGGFADGWSNLGLTLSLLGRHDEALDAYRTAVAADPLHANGHVGVALQTLLRGNFAEGWFEYQWRWRSTELTPPRIAAPAWQGEALAGRHILLVAEQGLGDTIQFCRYAALLRSAGAGVSLMVQRPLVRLLSANLPWATIVEEQPQHPACDVYCPLLTLPLLLGTTAETIPAAIPYLRAPPQLADAWRCEIGNARGLRVGLAWAGNPNHINNHNRSLPLAALAPLFAIDGITLVSLQVGPRAREAYEAPGDVIDVSAKLTDFADTAGLLTALDLVVSVDTSVVHLAGAMGVPVWVLLSVGTDWRWRLNREDTPWYPTMRLFRQRTYGAWRPTVIRVAEALAALVGVERQGRRQR